MRVAALLVVLCAACDGEPPPGAIRFGDGPDPTGRLLEGAVEIRADGLSLPLAFHVPDGTRSIACEVVGDDFDLHALGALRGPDGIEHVGLPEGIDARKLLEDVAAQIVAPIPHGDLYQLPRHGTFTAVTAAQPGWWVVRVASQANAGVHVGLTIRLPAATSDAPALHVNVLEVTDRDAADPYDPMAFVPHAQAIFAQAGVALVVDGVATLRQTAFSTLDDPPLGAPPDPSSEMAALVVAGRAQVATDALTVHVVDLIGLPSVSGFALSVPGPADPASYYYGVFARANADAIALGRTVAHELAHHLGLHHVRNTGLGGVTYDDPLPDTDPAVGNVMDFTGATTITPEQRAVLLRHPLVR